MCLFFSEVHPIVHLLHDLKPSYNLEFFISTSKSHFLQLNLGLLQDQVLGIHDHELCSGGHWKELFTFIFLHFKGIVSSF